MRGKVIKVACLDASVCYIGDDSVRNLEIREKKNEGNEQHKKMEELL